MALIRIIHEISNKSSIILDDLGISSENYSISYGLQKSAHKYFYDEGIFEDVHDVENWGTNDDYWALKFQSIIAGVYDMTSSRNESYEFLYSEISKFENFIKSEEKLLGIKGMNNLFEDIDKYVDLNLSNKKYDNSNIDIRWIENYSSTNLQLGITASVAQSVRKSETSI